MLVQDIIHELEILAPPTYQESYDNSGLICGDGHRECTGVLICLDSTEAIVDEAISKNCNLIVAHHPIVFSGLKQLIGKTYIERTLIKAIQNNVAIYAIHTNLDNMLHGVNQKFADTLGLKNQSILSPLKNSLQKISVFVPESHVEAVREALFNAGAGQVGNYSHCSFNIKGSGSFQANEDAQPHLGEKNSLHFENETRVEVLVEKHALNKAVRNLLNVHPYEEVAYDIVTLNNLNHYKGAGMVGEMDKPLSQEEFLGHVKSSMKTDCIKYTSTSNDKIQKVAICGGSGSFLLNKAIASGAQAFVTSDFKYHQFFDAENRIMICDIGHYESEQFTVDLIRQYLTEKFAKFAVRFTEINTNPVNYF